MDKGLVSMTTEELFNRTQQLSLRIQQFVSEQPELVDIALSAMLSAYLTAALKTGRLHEVPPVLLKAVEAIALGQIGVQRFQIHPDAVQCLGGQPLAPVIGQDGIHRLCQRSGHDAHPLVGLFTLGHMGHIEQQVDVTQGGLLGVFGQRGLRIEHQAEHRRHAVHQRQLVRQQ